MAIMNSCAYANAASPPRGGHPRGGGPIAVAHWHGMQTGARRDAKDGYRLSSLRGGAFDRHLLTVGGAAGEDGVSARQVRAGNSARAAGEAVTLYAGRMTPVDDETRPVPHPPGNAQVLRGSLREDVARYNEERGAGRPAPRSANDIARPPVPSAYRNN
jgi:hypothetical protein